MVQGISSQMIYSVLQNGLSDNYAKYGEILAQMGANTKLTSISDDPVAAVNVLKTQKGLDNVAKYLENIAIAQDELTELDDLLDSVLNDIAVDYKPLLVQASNGTYDKDSLKTMLTELEGGLETLINQANTKFNGNYVFSGANVKIPAYTINYDADGNVETVVYNGTSADKDYQRYVQTGEGNFEVINTTGDKVFGSYDGANGVSEGLIGTMVDSINALKTMIDENSTEAEVSDATKKLYTMLDSFDQNISDITTVQAKYASTFNNMEMSKTSLDDTKVNLTNYLSNLKDIDITEMSTELYNAMYSYQASMSLISQVYQTGTLLDYI